MVTNGSFGKILSSFCQNVSLWRIKIFGKPDSYVAAVAPGLEDCSVSGSGYRTGMQKRVKL